MGKVISFPAPPSSGAVIIGVDFARGPDLTVYQPAPEKLPAPSPRPEPSPIPANWFIQGDRVCDTQTGRMGVVTGHGWIHGSARPAQYEVRFDGAKHSETMLACRVALARPASAPPPAGRLTLYARSIAPATWWPGKGDDTDPPPPPRAA